MIAMDEKPDNAQLEKFSRILGNIAELSRSPSADALRIQLRACSGESIHMLLVEIMT